MYLNVECSIQYLSFTFDTTCKAYVADTIVVFHNDVRGLFNRVCEVLGHVHFATKMMNNKKI